MALIERNETYYAHRNQCEQLFPALTARAAARKLIEESRELLRADAVGDGSNLEEAADVMICLLSYIRKAGITTTMLEDAVKFKLDKTGLRTFELQPNGTYHHVKKGKK